MPPKLKDSPQEASEHVPTEKGSLLNKLKLVVKDYLDRKLDEIHLRKTVEEVEKASQQYRTVPISSLSLKEVVKAFDLKHDKDRELQQVTAVPLPPILVGTLALIDGASSRSPSTEATTRWIIDALLLNAHGIASSYHPHAQPINVQTERLYKHGPVPLKREKVMLSARPDYGIWYGENEAICLNVLIVEAKKADIESGVAQALGYMGCIHRERKALPKRDCTVYGMASNGSVFWFLKISNDSKWSEHMVVVRDGCFEAPLGLLVYMFRRAAVMSPAHSKESSYETTKALTVVEEDVVMKG